jgi:hypothetical protein
MAPKDYYAIVEGYNNKRRKQAELMRQSVWAGFANWKDSINYTTFCNRFFPLWFDHKEEFVKMELTKEQAEEIVKRHKKYHKKAS